MNVRITLKRFLLPLAIVLAGLGLAQTLRQFLPRPASTVQVVRTLESAFPQDVPVRVDVDLTFGSSELLTRRDLRDQVRDWLLLAALTASGLEAEKLNEVTFDLPPVRYGFLKPVADWEYGPVRSRAIGNGNVVALIPANAGAERIGYLCDIADQSRKNLGRVPERVIVLEYEMDADLASARLTRRETAQGMSLFHSEAGYVEQPVKNLQDFEEFQSRVDDLTYAAVRDGALVLGGRRIPGRPIRGIRTEDIAALWQAENKLTASSEEYKKFVDQKDRELKARWENRTYRRGDFMAEARLKRELEADQAQVAEEVEQYRKTHRVAESLGFSLDPTYDFKNLADFVAENLPRQPFDRSKQTHDIDTFPDIFSRNGNLLGGLDLSGALRSDLVLRAAEVGKVVESLRNGSPGPLLQTLQKLEGNRGEEFFDYCQGRFGLQAARYDGDLQYTEPGMVLFYTDLLAKLWAMNYQDSAPQQEIEDFVPLTRVKLSPVYRREVEELTNTRLWFGPQNKGFQISGSKEVLLSRIASRLYAASATSLKPGEESAPNAQSAAFLGWWDDHFEEVARFEPEYERLNEIMKWSLVLGWLHKNGDLPSLSYLGEVPVNRRNWFPDWVRRHAELRFQNWKGIAFYPRGAFGTETEALPRLRSGEFEEFGSGGHYFSGGVSLAGRETFAERPLLSTRVAEGLRRSNLRYTETLGDGFKTLENVEYNFTKNAGRYELAIKPNAEMRLRGRVGELANQPIGRTLEVRADGLEYRVRAAEAQIGSLNIERSANGFRIGWAGRDLDAGYALGRRLSNSGEIGKALADDSQVIASTKLADGTYVARVRGSSRWVRFGEEAEPSLKLDGEWQARAAGYETNARSVKMQWVDDGWVKEKAGAESYRGLVGQVSERVKPEEQLLDSISRRDFGRAARMIADDPINAYMHLDAAYRGQLAHADALVMAGKPAEAAEYLARMADVWGPTPDITLRRAVALADSNQLGAAAHVMERPAVGSARDVNSVYAELTRRIAASAAKSDNPTWQALLDANEWRALRTGGEPQLAAVGPRLELEYRLGANAAKGERVAVDEAVHSRAPLYVQDSPELRNLDWSTDVQGSLRQAVDGDLATVVRLPRMDIAHFRPARLYAPQDATALRKVEPSSAGNASRAGQNMYRSFESSACYTPDGRPPRAAARDCPEDQRSIYLVVPKRAEHQYE